MFVPIMNGSFFLQHDLETKFRSKGYALLPLLNDTKVNELKALTRELFFTYDNNNLRERCNYSSSLFEPDEQKRLKLFEGVRQIVGPELQKYLAPFDVVMVNYWNKLQEEGAVEIHQNWSHTNEPDNFTVTIWIPLQPVDRRNGTMEVVPHSHCKFETVRGINLGNPFLNISKEIVEHDLIPLNMQAGEAAIFDDGLLHYTGPNRTDSPREAVQLVIKPASAPARFYFRHLDKTEKSVEIFEADHPFYSLLQVAPGKTGRPQHGKSVGFADHKKNQLLPYRYFKNAIADTKPYSFTNYLQQELEQQLKQIAELQLPSGEFQTYEHYPNLQPGNWIKGPSSPFVTASILIALADIKAPLADTIKAKGCSFIESAEEKGLWRFWKNFSSKNHVPCDADDTSLCSFALKRIKNIQPDNLQLFNANRNGNGLFYTWFLPRASFITQPGRLLSFYNDSRIAANTIQSGFLHKDDVEVAVMANTLLYLGEKENTKATINHIIDTMKGGQPYAMHFYASDVFVWYHIARARHYSVNSFTGLQETFIAWFKQKEQTLDLKTDLPLAFALYNSAFYFGVPQIAENLLRKLIDGTVNGANFPYHYFTSKDRNYNAGSAALTLSWYAETLQNALCVYK